MTAAEHGLSEVFVVLADSLKAGYDVIDTMDALVHASVTFTSAIEAGIVLADPHGVLHIVASTSERASDVEEEQLGSTEGPCWDSFRSGEAVEVADIAAASGRWPGFAATAETRGFKAAHAVPLRLRTQILGSMNLFSDRIGALSDADTALVQALAEVATIGIIQQQSIQKGADLSDQLQHALESRIVIEQAKGVLAQRHGITIDSAFGLLRGYARRSNARLHDVAEQIASNQLTL